MAEEEAGHRRLSQSIQWVWVSPIFHSTCPRRTAEHQRGTNLFKTQSDLYQKPISEYKCGWWPFMDSSMHYLAEIFCNETPYILRTQM